MILEVSRNPLYYLNTQPSLLIIPHTHPPLLIIPHTHLPLLIIPHTYPHLLIILIPISGGFRGGRGLGTYALIIFITLLRQTCCVVFTDKQQW